LAKAAVWIARLFVFALYGAGVALFFTQAGHDDDHITSGDWQVIIAAGVGTFVVTGLLFCGAWLIGRRSSDQG
jgi:hypothetical protein